VFVNEDVSTPGHLLEGKYEIVGVVGEGAWGLVLEGINIRIRRRVAIKILKAEYASRPEMVSRFEREALASTHIDSPHVVQVFDAGVLADGRPYLVMEFLTGDDLGTHIRLIERLPVLTAVDLCAQVARGLAAAHVAGVFHRDMKPTNIFIARTKSGREIAKIVDFGISKLLDVSTVQVSHTQTGTVLGSPVYMSPEQARGSKASDHRSDLYSLGVVLFECLTGRPPHDGESFNALLFKIALEAAPSVRSLRPEIDEELDDIVRRLLAKHPEERPQSATELEGLLDAWLKKRGVKLGETPTDSGPRVLDGLTTSPIASLHSLSSGRSLTAGLPQLDATLLLESAPNGSPLPVHATTSAAAGDVPSIDGPGHVVPSPGASAPALEDSLPPSPQAAAAMPSPNRRLYVLAGGVALALLVGVIAVVAKRDPPIQRGLVTTDPSTEPLTAPTGEGRSAAATAPSLSVTGTSVDVTSASAIPRAGTGAPSGREPSGAQVARPVVPVVPASASASAAKAPSAPPSAEAQPAASSAGSASVGGRTIRTEF
jgi:serine/threonine-protein kinase